MTRRHAQRILFAGTVVLSLSSIPIIVPAAFAAGAGTDGQPLVYFRYPSEDACNVYMNYSFHAPHFSLMARDPEALSPQEQSFLAAFNDRFERLAHDRLAVCDLPAGAWLMPRAEQERRYAICTAAEERFGIAESRWAQSRLSAPSNCISSKLAAPGVISWLGQIRERPVSLAAWLAASRGR